MITYQHKPYELNKPYSFTREIGDNYQVLVKVGDIVRPETVLASGWQKSGFRTFNLAEMFGLKPEKTSNLLKKTIGSRVYQGDVLAQYSEWRGFKKKVFRSPMNGIITDYNSKATQLNLQYLPKEVKVPSGVYGKVGGVVPGRHINVVTKVNIVNNMLGFGVDRGGSLIEVGYPDIPIQSDHIMPVHGGKVLFGGTSITLDAMYKALSLGVKGIITGGIHYQDYLRLIGSRGRFEDIGVSLLVTEGYGNQPIFKDVYELLVKAANRHVFISVKESALVIPIAQDQVTKDDLEGDDYSRKSGLNRYGVIEDGQRVRLLTEQYFGEYGKVKSTSNGSAEVELVSGTVTVRIQNLEIIHEDEY